MATATVDLFTQTNLSDALSEVRARARILDLPHDVPNSGGVRLCWSMRLARAMRIAGDQPDNPNVTKAVHGLIAEVEALQRDYNAAVERYRTLCQQAGIDPEPANTPRCDCTGHRWIAAEQELQAAMWDLLLPDRGQSLPTLATLMSRKDNDEISKHLQRLAQAQVKYRDACIAFGETPKWSTVWNIHLGDIK